MALPVDLNPPRDWQVFEDFCWELFSAEWGDPNATKYGRSGEAQKGVDVFGRREGGWHGVQCKRRGIFPEKSLSEAEVRAEVGAAVQQRRKLDSLIIATTAPPSTKLSDLAAVLSEDVGFRVEVFGWEELVLRLQRHEALFLRWLERLGGRGLPHFSGVPARNPHFRGRDGLLDDLAERLAERAASALTQAVSGLGGIGKTQVAIELCHRYHDRYRHVIWALANSPEALTARYAELARQSGLAGLSAPDGEAAAGLLRWLSSTDSWLLVLDNVEERPEDLPLPAGPAGHLLVTSRLRTLPPSLGAGAPMVVDVLPIDEAVAFLLERVGRTEASDEERAAAQELAEEVDGLPLALEQAAAYVNDLELPFAVYLGLLRERREVLALEADSWGITGSYEKDVATTWLLNMEQLPETAQAVMNVCAYLAPEGIPLNLFVRHADLLGPPLEALAEELATDSSAVYRHLVGPLRRFSLFRVDREREELAVHRMVQWVARQRLERAEEGTEVLERAHTALRAAFPRNYKSPEVWAECSSLFPHVASVQQHWMHGAEGSESDPTPLWADAGFYAWVAGRSLDALGLEESVVKVRRRTLGQEHPQTLTSLNNLAETYRTLGDAAGAREILKQVVEVRRRVLGEEHPHTLASLNNLALTLWSLGDAEGARQIHEEVVEVRRRVLGEEHPDTLASLNNLAVTLRALCDAEGARQILEQVVEVHRRVLGEEHPNTLTSLNNLALTHQTLGDAAGARKILEEVVEVRRRVLGEEHPNTLTSLNNLAETLRALGDAEGARLIHEQVVEVHRRVLGEEHPHTLASLRNLAETRRALEEAEGSGSTI